MIFEADKYAKAEYPMPNRDSKDITPKDKEKKEYNLAIARSVYSEFCGGRTYGGADLYNEIDEYRAYAYGQQSNERYRDAYYGRQQNSTILGTDEDRMMKRKAFSALDFSIMSPAPRVIDALIGKISKLTDVVSVDPTDAYSSNLKEDIKWGTYVDSKYEDQFRLLKALAGIPHERPTFTPRNIEELNLYDAEGGFKLSYAEAMEELLFYTFNLSRWDETIQEKLIFDLICTGFACVEDVYDEATGQVRVEYRDAKFAGVQYTKEDSYENPDYGFVVQMMKISDLKARGFDEDDLKGLARKFSDRFGNPSNDDWTELNKVKDYARMFDDFKVPVFNVYWIDVDYENELEYTTRTGKKVYSDYNGEKLDNRRRVLTTRVKYLRSAKWIIDTNLIFEYGKVKNQVRDGWSHPVIPIHMMKTLGRPIIPRIIPALDLYMNSWMKFQQGIRMAALNGFSIEMGAISNLSLGGKKLDPISVIKMWRETGIMFRKDTNVVGQMNVASKAIEPIAGGAGIMLKEALDGMTIATNIIEEVTGINAVTLGATPEKGQGKALTEYAIGATNVILNSIVKPANFIKQDVARSICLRLQQVVRNESKAKQLYGAIIGDTRLELLRVAEGHDVTYGIRTTVRPTDEEKQYLTEMISLSLKNGRDGKVGITEADAIKFFSMIKQGRSLKRVALLLDFANRKAQEEAEARAMRAQQMEAEKNNQYAMIQAQIKQQEQMMDAQSTIIQEQAKGHTQLVLKAYEKDDITYEQAMNMLMPQQQQATQQPPKQQPEMRPQQ